MITDNMPGDVELLRESQYDWCMGPHGDKSWDMGPHGKKLYTANDGF
jgi:hypothetical protein